MEFVVPIAAHVVLVALLAGLFIVRRTTTDGERLSDPDAALPLFCRQYGGTRGTATLSADGRAALLSLLPHTGTGLVVRRGRRWCARRLGPGDVRQVARTADRTLTLYLADFGWAPIRFEMPDTACLDAWRSRLDALTSAAPLRRSAERPRA